MIKTKNQPLIAALFSFAILIGLFSFRFAFADSKVQKKARMANDIHKEPQTQKISDEKVLALFPKHAGDWNLIGVTQAVSSFGKIGSLAPPTDAHYQRGKTDLTLTLTEGTGSIGPWQITQTKNEPYIADDELGHMSLYKDGERVYTERTAKNGQKSLTIQLQGGITVSIVPGNGDFKAMYQLAEAFDLKRLDHLQSKVLESKS